MQFVLDELLGASLQYYEARNLRISKVTFLACGYYDGYIGTD